LVLIVLLTVQVLARFVFNKSIAWTEELSRIAFVWVVYSSVVYAAKLDKHIRLTFVLMALPAKGQKIILTIADFLWLSMNLLITYQSILYILRLFRYPYISQTLGINLVYAYFIIPFGFAAMSFRIIQCMIVRLKSDIEIHDSRLDM
jgi:TRAP-type C4-dicarboxylate transport system permease small subunit